MATVCGSVVAFRTLRPAAPRAEAPARIAAPSAEATAAERPVDGRIRIGLRSLNGQGSLQVTLPAGSRAVRTSDGRVLKRLPAGVPFKVIADYDTGQVVIRGEGASVQAEDLTLSGSGLIRVGSRRRYPGQLRIRMEGTGLHLTNELDIEQYLEGVLPGEIPPSFGIEAQKAMAVAARTYALVQRGKHGEFDLCDRTCCQMYLGHHRGSRRGLAAVRATRRQCLWSEDELVYAFYSADCGGISTRVEDVPLKDKPAEPLPYLVPVSDRGPGGEDYCETSPYHDWTRRLKRDELEERLNSEPTTQVGRLVDVRVGQTDATGRMLTVIVTTKPKASAEIPIPAATATEQEMSAWEFRRSVGPMTLKSTLLTIDQPEPGLFRFRGKGFGHGLGLCQIGANGMARHGKGFREILSHYYPGTRVAPLADPDRKADSGNPKGVPNRI